MFNRIDEDLKSLDSRGKDTDRKVTSMDRRLDRHREDLENHVAWRVYFQRKVEEVEETDQAMGERIADLTEQLQLLQARVESMSNNLCHCNGTVFR